MITTVAGALHMVGQVQDALKNAGKVGKHVENILDTKSLIDITKEARVEPICLIDVDVLNIEYLTDIMQSLLSVFSGYYLQAVALTNSVGDISVASKLSPLNPNRGGVIPNMFESMKPDLTLSAESYKYRLPTKKNANSIALEAPSDDRNKLNNTTVMDLSNLSVGKLFDVEVNDGQGHTAVVKISVRLMATSIPTSTIVSMLSFKDHFDMDLKERYHGWKSGRLSFIKDLVLCNDIVDKHRKMLLSDKTGVYSQILNRETNNFLQGIVTRSPSLATASNLIIMSTDTLAQVEQKIGGNFSNYKIRARIFDNSNLMIIAVVDKGWERISLYHRGIHEVTQVGVRDIRVSNKGSGPDIADILKAYTAGAGPSL